MTGRRRRKINSTHLRKWNTRAHKWVVHGRGFWSDFRRGFRRVLDPVTKYGSTLLGMIPEVGPLISTGLNAINNIQLCDISENLCFLLIQIFL